MKELLSCGASGIVFLNGYCLVHRILELPFLSYRSTHVCLLKKKDKLVVYAKSLRAIGKSKLLLKSSD